MTHVVGENCIGCRYSDCVTVCPVDCFHLGPNFMAIDPVECIDCGKCIPECPCDAIFAEEDLPADQQHMTALNQELAAIFPVVTAKLDPLPDADAWKGKPGKLSQLVRS
jgi:ferredoxin